MVDIDSVPKLPLQHCLRVTFTGLIKYMSTTLPTTTSKAPRANWNDAEITALIDYLIKNLRRQHSLELLELLGPITVQAPKKQHRCASRNINQ
jgi:hypothetical protein